MDGTAIERIFASKVVSEQGNNYLGGCLVIYHALHNTFHLGKLEHVHNHVNILNSLI